MRPVIIVGVTKIENNNPVQSESNDISEKLFRRILLGIVIFAFLIRLVSIDHNLPYQIISDEGSDLTTAVRLLQGELPARHVRYHRSLIAYSNLVPITGVFVINYLDGDVRSIEDFQNLYFSNRAEFTFATRLWMSILTTGAIAFTGLAASYINRKVGLLASLILALNAYYFHISLFALPDALGTSMTALAIWTIMRVWKYRRTRDYILMSLALALVMLAKLQASTIGIGFLIAHGYISYENVEGNWKRLPIAYISDKNFLVAAVTGILANILFNPLAFIYIDDLIFEIERMRSAIYGQDEITISLWTARVVEELTNVVFVIFRWITFLIFLAIIPVWNQRRHAPYIIIIAMMIFISWIALSSRLSPRSQFYYWSPVVIVGAITGGIGGVYLIDALQSLRRSLAFPIAVVIICSMIVLEGSFLLQMFGMMNQETTQELAREWIVENVEADSPIISGSPIIVSAPINRNEDSINRAMELRETSLAQWDWYLAQAEDRRPTPAYEIYGPEYLIAIDSYEDLQVLIAEASIEYIVFTDYNCSGQDDDPAINSLSAYPPRSSSMINNWELVFSASSYASGACDSAIHPRTKISFSEAIYQHIRTGPYIEIYRIP